MNKENMLKVADAIEEANKGNPVDVGDRQIGAMRFDMRTWVERTISGEDWCGAYACVAGFAATLAMKGIPNPDEGLISIARKFLGLEAMVAISLFAPSDMDLFALNRRKDSVPDAIRWMAKTGIVDWIQAMREIGKPFNGGEDHAQLARMWISQ